MTAYFTLFLMVDVFSEALLYNFA